MARPAQVALVLLVFANGALLATWRGAPVSPSLAALMVASVLVVLVASAAHLTNEAIDHATDRLTERTPFSGGSGALEASGLEPALPLRVAGGASVAALTGAIMATATGWLAPIAAVLLLVGLAGGVAYSLPPLAAMRRGLGEPLNALLGGLLLPLYGVAVVASELELLDILAFAPFACAVFASVLATAWPDREADAATGKGTLQVRLARHTLRRIHMSATIAFVATTVVATVSGAMPLAWAGLAVLPALIVGTAGYTRRRSPLPNVAAMVGLALLTALGLGLALWA